MGHTEVKLCNKGSLSAQLKRKEEKIFPTITSGYTEGTNPEQIY